MVVPRFTESQVITLNYPFEDVPENDNQSNPRRRGLKLKLVLAKISVQVREHTHSAIGLGSEVYRRCQEPSPTVTLCSLGTISCCVCVRMSLSYSLSQLILQSGHQWHQNN